MMHRICNINVKLKIFFHVIEISKRIELVIRDAIEDLRFAILDYDS